jgi:hypothetical protein
MFFLVQQNQRTRGWNRFYLKVGGVAPIVNTHVSKCKNDKIKLKINKLFLG